MIVIASRGPRTNAAQFDRYLLETTLGVPVELAAASVSSIYGAKVRQTDAAVAGISQSGESTDVAVAITTVAWLAGCVLTHGILFEFGRLPLGETGLGLLLTALWIA